MSNPFSDITLEQQQPVLRYLGNVVKAIESTAEKSQRTLNVITHHQASQTNLILPFGLLVGSCAVLSVVLLAVHVIHHW